jgi:hypothetical protein
MSATNKNKINYLFFIPRCSLTYLFKELKGDRASPPALSLERELGHKP